MGFSVKVALIGIGTVGCGVIRVLEENRKTIESKLGFPLKLKWVCDIDLERERPVSLEPYQKTTDYREIINDEEVDIVIELVGGINPAKSIILDAIKAKKHVVTANKALLAEEGLEILESAKRCGVDIGFEASVAGGIPIVKAIREGLCANDIVKIYGIINGTANYILTKMEKEELTFEEALSMAQEEGYAEADPTLDIEGIDAAHKTAILATLASGEYLSLKDVFVEGIKGLSKEDIGFARDFGYKVKLLSIIKKSGEDLELRVHPTLIPENHSLAKVEGAFNAVSVVGNAVGHTMFYGMGAGMLPTASAVVADVMDIARDISKGISQRVPVINSKVKRGLNIIPIDELTCKYYIRFSAVDRPGVLSKISGVLGKHSISIESVIQKGRREKGFVPVVMMTHEAKEKDVQKALKEIDTLDVVGARTVLIRVEENEHF
ncbi:MAG: homoserine dehydrogenase [Deferribacteres bacterium]|nr:homoserine dehydrogenase [Deferribacteres bacterium]